MLARCIEPLAVFSAHAEVVPNISVSGLPSKRILRARGGSSPVVIEATLMEGYSPRTRR